MQKRKKVWATIGSLATGRDVCPAKIPITSEFLYGIAPRIILRKISENSRTIRYFIILSIEITCFQGFPGRGIDWKFWGKCHLGVFGVLWGRNPKKWSIHYLDRSQRLRKRHWSTHFLEQRERLINRDLVHNGLERSESIKWRVWSAPFLERSESLRRDSVNQLVHASK